MSAAALVDSAREAVTEAYLRTDDYASVAGLLDDALVAARATGDRKAEAAALAQQGMLLHFRAIVHPPEERATIDPGPEQELFERALAVRREANDAEGIAESLWHLGLVHQVLRRDSGAAIPYFRDALARIESVVGADTWLRSEIHRHIGFDLLVREERYEDALAELRRSFELRETLAESGWCVSGLTALAAASRRAGRHEDAIAYALRAVDLAREEGLLERHVAAAENELRAAETLER